MQKFILAFFITLLVVAIGLLGWSKYKESMAAPAAKAKVEAKKPVASDTATETTKPTDTATSGTTGTTTTTTGGSVKTDSETASGTPTTPTPSSSSTSGSYGTTYRNVQETIKVKGNLVTITTTSGTKEIKIPNNWSWTSPTGVYYNIDGRTVYFKHDGKESYIKDGRLYEKNSKGTWKKIR
jgi:hypothetical protein